MKPIFSSIRVKFAAVSRLWRHGWLLFVMSAMIALVIHLPAIALTPKAYNELEFPPLPEIVLPDYERYQLENGMVVYLMEDHTLPLVGGNVLVNTGSRYEPADQVGLADVALTVMRTGGTKKHPADQLNQILEQRAASVETTVDDSSGGVSFSALTEDFDLVFDLFAEVIQKPVFPQDKIELKKSQAAGAIARRNDEPDDIASREFYKQVYGAESPYARTVEYATLNNIQRQDLLRFYRTYFRPEQMILGVVGDIDVEATKAKIQATFGSWQSKTATPSLAAPKVDTPAKQGLFLVDLPQLTQSNILVGHQGGQLSNPDYPQLTVMNGVMNGFGGRLFNEIRSRQGLAYSVYGVWSARYDYDGLFIAGGSTRSEATVPFLQALQNEFQRLQSEKITEAELFYAKESILNSFVFNFRDPEQTLSRLMRYEFYDYPEDFIFQYQQGVKSTTIDDVQRVAQTYLKPDALTVVVVGNAQEINPPLQEFMPAVTPLDVTIPEPPTA